MSEWFWFVLKFPLIVFLFLLIGAFFSDPSLLKVLFGIYSWPFLDGGADNLISIKFPRRLGITILCWVCVGTALFCWLKWGTYQKSFWTELLGVENVNRKKEEVRWY